MNFASLTSRAFLGLAFGWVVILSGCAGPGHSPGGKRGVLARLMVERLGWMDEVARVKLAKSLPVTDAKREAELLHAMEQEGARAGLPKAAVRAFFAGQMDAAKRYQEEWLKAHAGLKEDAASLPDLAKTVRPALDGIGKQMIAALVAARRDSDAVWDAIAAGRAALDRAGYSQAVQAPAIRGLELGLGVARNER